MNISLQTDVSGFITLARNAPFVVRREVSHTLHVTVADRLLKAIRAVTRVDTGRMRRSTSKRRAGGRNLELGYRVPYAKFVEGPPLNDRNLQKVTAAHMPWIRQKMEEAVIRGWRKLRRGQRGR